MDYNPEKWMILKINGEDPHYRVLGSWYGGYLGADSWRLNSGIVEVKEEGDFWHFYGASGSKYVCHKEAYGGHMTAKGISAKLESEQGAEILENQNWLEIDWIIK